MILACINWVNKPYKLRFTTNRINTCPCWSNSVLHKCPDNAFDIGVEVFWMSSSLSYLVNVYDHDRGILLTRQHDVFAWTECFGINAVKVRNASLFPSFFILYEAVSAFEVPTYCPVQCCTAKVCDQFVPVNCARWGVIKACAVRAQARWRVNTRTGNRCRRCTIRYNHVRAFSQVDAG